MESTPSSLKAPVLAALLCAARIALADPAPAQVAEPKPVSATNADSDAAAGASSKSEKKHAAAKRITLPLVQGEPNKGLRIPYMEDGKLKMDFSIGLAKLIDQDHVDMSEMRVETFTDDGSPEMTVDMPNSTFDLASRILTSHARATIRRQDFDITGDSVVFNTLTKRGEFVGHVHMYIYDNKKSADSAQGSPVPPSAKATVTKP